MGSLAWLIDVTVWVAFYGALFLILRKLYRKFSRPKKEAE